MNKEVKRNINIDIIKVFALFLVATMHFFLTGYYELTYEKRTIPFIAIRNFSAICVPLFIMTTGYLLANKTWSKKYYLSVLSTFFMYITATTICGLFDMKFIITWRNFLKILENIVAFEYYGWYMNMYFGLVLIAPAINIIYKNFSTRNQKKLMLLHLFFLISIPVTLLDIFSTTGHQVISHILPTWWKGMYPIVYYTLGLYIKEYGESFKKKNLTILFWVTIIISTLAYYIANLQWETTTYPSIFLVIMASITFIKLINLDIKLKPQIEKIVIFISTNTLSAYLLSWIIDTLIMRPIIKGWTENLQLRLYLLPTVLLSFTLTIIATFIFKTIYDRSINVGVKKLIKKLT